MAGKILIVDDVAANRAELGARLVAARYETAQADSAGEALRLCIQERPDLVMIGTHLAGPGGASLCRQLKQTAITAEIPVILVSNHCDTKGRLAALRAGADDFLSKPINDILLLARLRSLLRARETDEELRLRDQTCRTLGFAEAAEGFSGPARIALIAADRATGAIWETTLSGFMPRDLFTVLAQEEVLGAADLNAPPDAYVISADLAHRSEGLRLMSELRARPATRHAVICIVMDTAPSEGAAMALDLGANDLLPADMASAPLAEEAALRLRRQLAGKRIADRRRQRVADGLRLAVTDPLTGLHNRRYALPHLSRVADQAQKTGQQFAVMILDLDRFKSINDTLGHSAGDGVLVEVARRLDANLREGDLVARIGGEEFLVVMPETSLGAARVTAERLCRAIEREPIEPGGGHAPVSITISIGLAIGGGDGAQSTDDLVSQADRALLRSKAGGRNRVHISGTASAA